MIAWHGLLRWRQGLGRHWRGLLLVLLVVAGVLLAIASEPPREAQSGCVSKGLVACCFISDHTQVDDVFLLKDIT
jgi:hypothetical protein